jgi:hypothetical protein
MLPEGKAMPVAGAKLTIAGQEHALQTELGQKAATFKVRLKSGIRTKASRLVYGYRRQRSLRRILGHGPKGLIYNSQLRVSPLTVTSRNRGGHAAGFICALHAFQASRSLRTWSGCRADRSCFSPISFDKS